MDHSPRSPAQFFDDWSSLRAQVRSGQKISRAALDELQRIALPSHDMLMAALEVEVGQVSNDQVLLAAAIQRLARADAGELGPFLQSLPDLTILGPPQRRLASLREFWTHQLGPNDAAVRALLSTRAPAENVSVAGILDDMASRLDLLEANLSQELRLQIGWRALELWSRSRSTSFLQILKSREIALSAAEASYWEYELLRAVFACAQGFIDDAQARIAALVSGPACTGWRRRQVARAMTGFAAFAAPYARAWIDSIPEAPFLPHEATSPAEAIGSSLCASLLQPRQEKKALAGVRPMISGRTNDAFLLLLEIAGSAHARHVSEPLLAALEATPDAVKRLPWAGREEAFVKACSGVVPGTMGVRLLALCAAEMQSIKLAQGLVELLDAADSQTLEALPHAELSRLVTDLGDRATSATRKFLGRGLVHRAVIDGSNLCLVGTSKGNKKGSLRYLDQAMSDLEEAGFREIVVFFDASTRHDMSDADWRQVEELEKNRKASVVRGVADPHVIRAFLELPDASWIVTGDDYKDHLAEFPALAPFWFRNRLHFHVDQRDRIAWDRPLDAIDLPKGAPVGPCGGIPRSTVRRA